MIYFKITLLSIIVLISILTFIKLFIGRVIFETKAEYSIHNLIIERTGFYSLWISGKILRKPKLEIFNAKITDVNLNKVFEIPSVFRPNSNNGSNGSRLLKYYYLKKGTYQFEIENEREKSLNFLDNTIGKILSSRETTEFEYKIKKNFA
jgi:hypothetical protein